MIFIHFNRNHRTANQLASMFDIVFPSAVLYCIVHCVLCLLFRYVYHRIFVFGFVLFLFCLFAQLLHIFLSLLFLALWIYFSVFYLVFHFIWHVSWPKRTWLSFMHFREEEKKWKQNKTNENKLTLAHTFILQIITYVVWLFWSI